MESSSATDDTLRLYTKLINIYNNVGVVFQSYLRRTYDDLNDIEDFNASLNIDINDLNEIKMAESLLKTLK